MDKDQLATLKEHIHARMESLNADIRAFEELVKPVAPDNAIGRLTRMEAINSKSMNEAALRKARENLKRLGNIQKNFSDPDFGLCIECEEPIPFARLMAVPESLYCVRCAVVQGG